MRTLPWLLIAIVLSGCSSDPRTGYSLNPGSEQTVSSIAVPIFENVTFRPGLEHELTKAIQNEVHRSTPWSVMPEGRADSTLRGVITEVSLRKLNTDQTSGLGSEYALDIVVDFRWRENATAQTLLERKSFRGVGRFAPGPGVREPIEFGEQEAVDRLARSIVRELRTTW
ncbi:MAG: LPS assembly lipoprotein LptE [Phycisphaerales bacterium JB043]